MTGAKLPDWIPEGYNPVVTIKKQTAEHSMRKNGKEDEPRPMQLGATKELMDAIKESAETMRSLSNDFPTELQ